MGALVVEQGAETLIVLDAAPGALILGGMQGSPGAPGTPGPQQFYLGGAQPGPIAVPILWLKDSDAPNAQAGDYDVEVIPNV